MSACALALSVIDETGSRDKSRAGLERAGYEVVEFSDCENACAWLDEETPSIAVIATSQSQSCSTIMRTLRDRSVPIFSSSAE